MAFDNEGLVYAAIVLPALRFLCNRPLFRATASNLIKEADCQSDVYADLRAKRERFGLSTAELTFKYLGWMLWFIVVQVGLYVVDYNKPWVQNAKDYSAAWPSQELNFPVKIYFFGQCLFYAYNITALLVLETERRDFPLMLTQNIVTLLLLCSSYMISYFQLGVLVLALHDVSDVLIEATAIIKYTKISLRACVSLGFLALLWLVMKLVFLPLFILEAAIHDLFHLNLDGIYAYLDTSIMVIVPMFILYWSTVQLTEMWKMLKEANNFDLHDYDKKRPQLVSGVSSKMS